MYIYIYIYILGNVKGSATDGQFRKCGLTVLLAMYDPKTTRQGCATRLCNPKENMLFPNLPFTMDP